MQMTCKVSVDLKIDVAAILWVLAMIYLST